MPMGQAVSPKPTAAMLAKEGVGARSGTSPFSGFVHSQNHANVRAWTSSRKA
jgi:hypothetical protein